MGLNVFLWMPALQRSQPAPPCLAYRQPDELSGCARPRVALARLVITEPRILLRDEPLSGLDVGTKLKVVEGLQAWNEKRHIPILDVTHSPGEAMRLGESVIYLE